MKRALFDSVLIFFGVVYLFSFPGFSAESPQSEETKQIVALVNSAATLVESKGRDAFVEFKKKDSKWYNQKTYVFVDDINGTVLVNPPTPEIEGKNLIDMKDAKGKALIREFIKTAKTKGSGWWIIGGLNLGKRSPRRRGAISNRRKCLMEKLSSSVPAYMASNHCSPFHWKLAAKKSI